MIYFGFVWLETILLFRCLWMTYQKPFIFFSKVNCLDHQMIWISDTSLIQNCVNKQWYHCREWQNSKNTWILSGYISLKNYIMFTSFFSFSFWCIILLCLCTKSIFGWGYFFFRNLFQSTILYIKGIWVKMLKMTISTSVCSAQLPNAGRNIQQSLTKP